MKGLMQEGEFQIGERNIDEWWDRYQAGEFTHGYKTRKQPKTPAPKKETTVTEISTVRAAEWLRTLGRKVEMGDLDNDVTDTEILDGLTVLAEGYARNYTGDFEFMVDMKAALEKNGKLSIGQTKGTLNCLRAQVERDERSKAQAKKATAAKADAPKIDTSAIPAGRYAIEEDGELHFFKVDHGKGKWDGFTFLSIQASDDEYPIKNRDRKTAILQAIGADPRAAMARYGHEIGRCGVCGATLTDADSRARGIGPICNERF